MSSNSMVKRATVSDYNRDRITELPDGIIENILSRLTLSEAVRTSILSRPWRYKWITLPDLDFDSWRSSLFLVRNPNWEAEGIVDYVLARHEGPIVKFKFTCPNATAHLAMDRWIHFLLDHPVEYLSLSWSFLNPNANNPLLPTTLFSFDHLKHLFLRDVKVTLPPEFKGFSKIVNLELYTVKIELEDLKTLISGCPILVCLKLGCVDTQLWFLEIDAPNLKCFHFHGTFSGISFRNAGLEEIKITLLTVNSYEFIQSRSNLFEVFNLLPSVKKVSLNGGFLQFLALGDEPQIIPGNLNHLTSLDINDFVSGSMDEISCAICLIKSSPNLQSLEISFDDWFGDDDAYPEYLEAEQTCNVSLSHLKYVRLCGVSGLESQLEFVRLILMWATALEKLEILTWFRCETDDELDVDPNDPNDFETLSKKYELLKTIASYPRASSKVALVLDKF